MSFCGTPLMPCRKPVSMATLSKASLLSLESEMNTFNEYCFNDIFLCFLAFCRLDRQTQATTLVHQIFGGYLRSRGTFSFIHRQVT